MKALLLTAGVMLALVDTAVAALKTGKPFFRERIDLAKSKGQFWQDYKFTDPATKKIMPKQMYCERLDDTAVCAGIYKR